MFRIPTSTPEQLKKLEESNPITTKGAEVSVDTVRRVILTILHENGVDIDKVDRDALKDHVTLILTAGATAGSMATFEHLKKTSERLEDQPFYKGLDGILPEVTLGINTGTESMAELARSVALDFAKDLRDRAKVFFTEHPLKD